MDRKPELPVVPAELGEPRHRSRTPFLLALSLLVGLATTAALFLTVRAWEVGVVRRRIEPLVQDDFAAIRQDLEREVAILHSLRALWTASHEVSAAEFGAFVAEHVRANRDVAVLAWLERVTALERASFEQRPRPDGNGSFEIFEMEKAGPVRASRRDEYVPVTYAEPLAGAPWLQRTLGYDHFAFPDRRDALVRAKESGSLVCLGPVPLTLRGTLTGPQPAAAERVLLFYLPIFAGGGVPPTLEERDRSLLGYVCAILFVDLLLDDVLPRDPPLHTLLQVFVDAENARGHDLVFSSDPAATAPRAAPDDPLAWSHSFTFAQRRWTAVGRPTEAVLQRNTPFYSWVALLFGLCLTAAGTALLWRLTGDRRKLSKEIRQFWRLSSELLCVLDGAGRLRRTNPAWQALLGYAADELAGRPLTDLVHPDDHAPTKSALERLATTSSTLSFETRLKTAAGQWRWIQWNAAPTDDRQLIHAVARDVTTDRENREELEQRATIDPLTGVLNRRALFDKLGAELHRAQRYGSPLTVALIDLDRFKDVNDTHGHPVGDRVLRRVGQLLRESLRESDLVGRYGGDEFLLVMPEANREAGRQAADRVLKALRGDATVRTHDGRAVALRASVGVAQLDAATRDAADLVSRADQALYRAKEAGRNCVA